MAPGATRMARLEASYPLSRTMVAVRTSPDRSRVGLLEEGGVTVLGGMLEVLAQFAVEAPGADASATPSPSPKP